MRAQNGLVAALRVIFFALLSVNTASAQVAVATDDAYVQANFATTNYGSGPGIILKNNVSSNNINVRLGYMQFDLSSGFVSFPSTYVLNMVVSGNNQGAVPSPPQSFPGAMTSDPATFVLQVWGLTANTAWSEGTMTWNTAVGSPRAFNVSTASQTGWGFDEAQAQLLATCSLGANTPPSTFTCGSTALTNFMNSNIGQTNVTLMFRRTDTNSQANLTFATKQYNTGVTAGTYAPTFGPPGEFGTTSTAGPTNTYIGTIASVTTSVPTSSVVADQIQANLAGLITSTGGDNPVQYLQYRVNPAGPWTIVNLGVGFSSYTTTVTGLLPGTTYDVQAYATNQGGTSFGSILNFTTPALPSATSITGITGIPTLSNLGLLLMATLIGIFGLRLVKRH